MSALTAAALCWLGNAKAEPSSRSYRIDRIVQPSAFHGVHGVAFDASGRLFAGSVLGAAIYSVDAETGRVDMIVSPPEGMADDLVFLADGTMVWTSITVGLVRARKGDERGRVIAHDLPGINSIAVRKNDGRLFAAQVFYGDGVWELEILRLDVTAGSKRTIARALRAPEGLAFGSDGNLYVTERDARLLTRINPRTGTGEAVATNLPVGRAGGSAGVAAGTRGTLYVSSDVENSIYRFTPPSSH